MKLIFPISNLSLQFEINECTCVCILVYIKQSYEHDAEDGPSSEAAEAESYLQWLFPQTQHNDVEPAACCRTVHHLGVSSDYVSGVAVDGPTIPRPRWLVGLSRGADAVGAEW